MAQDWHKAGTDSWTSSKRQAVVSLRPVPSIYNMRKYELRFTQDKPWYKEIHTYSSRAAAITQALKIMRG